MSQSTEVARLAPTADGIRTQARLLMTAVTAMPAAEIADALKDIALAREWAKLHDAIEQARADLLMVEVTCLARIGALSAESVLPPGKRSAATYFASWSESMLQAAVDVNVTAMTAVGLVKMLKTTDEAQADRRRGDAWASGVTLKDADEDRYDGWYDHEMTVSERAQREAMRINDALAVLLGQSEWLDHKRDGFTVSDLAEDLMDDTQAPRAFIEGVKEVCRQALRSAPVLLIDGHLAPRFVTCQSPTGTWLRVPFENANVGQLREMVALRVEQLKQDKAAYERLLAISATYADQPDAAPCVLANHESRSAA